MSSRPKTLGVFVTGICVSALFADNYAAANAQYADEIELATGTILLANEKLGDPNFSQSVILLVQVDRENGTVGLVLNRRSEIPIAKIFPSAKHATKDAIYLGGPVGITSVQALLQLTEKTDQAVHVVDDVYVSGAKDLIDKSIDSQADPSKFRLYLGYAGWEPGQLEAEIRLGAWSIMKGSSKIVFDPHPDSLWSRLTREAQMRLALSDSGRHLAPAAYALFPNHYR